VLYSHPCPHQGWLLLLPLLPVLLPALLLLLLLLLLLCRW